MDELDRFFFFWKTSDLFNLEKVSPIVDELNNNISEETTIKDFATMIHKHIHACVPSCESQSAFYHMKYKLRFLDLKIMKPSKSWDEILPGNFISKWFLWRKVFNELGISKRMRYLSLSETVSHSIDKKPIEYSAKERSKLTIKEIMDLIFLNLKKEYSFMEVDSNSKISTIFL